MNLSINALKTHPDNNVYFDDITGQDYENMKTSIINEGIMQPLLVAADMTILGGHQRYRIAKELGLETVPVIIREDIKTDEDKLRYLIASNFGRTKNDQRKQDKAAAKYVELRGYGRGEAGMAKFPNLHYEGLEEDQRKLTLSEIAEELGVSKSSLERSLRIERNLSDDMKDLLDRGVVSRTVASNIIAFLSPEDQESLLSSLDATKKYTQREVENAIRNIQSENAILRTQKAQLEASNERLSNQITELRNNPRMSDELRREKIKNSELQNQLTKKDTRMKSMQMQLDAFNEQAKKFTKDSEENKKLQEDMSSIRRQIEELKKQSNALADLKNLSFEVGAFLNGKLAPTRFYHYISEIDEEDIEAATKEIKKLVAAYDEWSKEMHNILS